MRKKALSSRRDGVYGQCADTQCKMDHRSRRTSCPFECPRFKRITGKNWKRVPERS